MTQPAQAEFSKWRSYVWPIYAFELKKFLPMLLMMLFITFNYTVFRDTKDTLVVKTCGAQAISFLKFWGVLPGAVIFTLIYAKLANIMKRENLFYAFVTPFLIFFGLFAYWLHPNQAALAPTTSAETLAQWLPERLSVLVSIYRNWPLALFYIFAELWGTVGISLLFWGFANDTTRVGEAKRFYAIFGLGASVGQILAGWVVKNIAAAGHDNWSHALQRTLGFSLVAGAIILGLYYYMQNYVLKDPAFAPTPSELRKKSAKPKLSIKESISFLANSRYLLSIAILVMSYGIMINLCEVPWKDCLNRMYPEKPHYQAFMGNFSMMNGTLTIFMMLFVGGNVIRKLGWYVGAVFTPVVLVGTGVIFFTLFIFQDNLTFISDAIGISILKLLVIVGTIQNIFSKSSKYSLFDPTKEMTYIPLSPDAKTKGKAAIDVVGARLGKSGGSLLLQVLLVLNSNNFVACGPYLFVMLLIVGGGWITSVGILSEEFATVSKQAELDQKTGG